MKPAITIVAIILAIIVIVIALIAYSYTQIQVSLDDISFAGIDWVQASLSTLFKLGLNVLTGNWLGAALSLVQGIKLNLIFGLTNHGFFPVYIPDLSYDLSVNGINVGHGTSNVDATINPGETKSLPVLQDVLIDSLKPAVSSIVALDGILNLKVSGTAYFKFLGFTIPVPFESTKQISIVGEIKKHFSESSQQSSYSQPLTQTYISLQASNYQVSQGQSITFTGQLTDSNGQGLSNQLVSVKSDTPLFPDSTFGSAYTDSNGRFSVDWLASKPHWYTNTANVYATFEGSSDYSSARSSEITIQVLTSQVTQSPTQNPSSSLEQQLQQAHQKIQASQSSPSVTIANSVYKVGHGTYTYITFYNPCSSTVTGSFSAEAALGDNIIVYLLDQDNFNTYKNGNSPQAYYYSGKVATGNFNVGLSPGTYYIIISNTYSSF